MIQKALQFTSQTLDQFLKNRFELSENKVILNAIVEGNGSMPQVNQNKVVMSLINIEWETVKPFYVRNQKLSNGSFSSINPTERYNLYILITANHDDYQETLKFLNTSILFFQTHPSIDSSSNSNLPKGINKLDFEIEKIDYYQMHNLWSAMGAKYQPSVIYKMRLVSIQANETTGFDAAVSQSSNSAHVS